MERTVQQSTKTTRWTVSGQSKSEQPTNFQKSQSKQSSNYPAGQQVINQFVKVSVKAVIL